MAENCLYCGTAFTKSRRNKIYCNNSCKQLGYFQRKYAGFNGTPQIETVKKISAPIAENLKLTPVNTVFTQINSSTIKTVKSENETVKEINTVKPMENNVKTVKDSISVKDMKDLFLRFTEKLTGQFNEAIVIMEQRLHAKHEALFIKQTETENVKQLCTPLPFYGITKPLLPESHKTDFTLSDNPSIVKPEETVKTGFMENTEIVNPDTVKDGNVIEEEEQEENEQNEHLELYETVSSQDEEEETENDEEEDQQEETESEQEINNANFSRPQKPEKSQETEPPYQWVESKLLQNIVQIVERGNNERFFSVIGHAYDFDEAKSMRWLNDRLRCLIEGLIKISNKKEVDKYTFLCLTDAFNRIVNSKSYKIAPNDYPYKQIINEYCLKLNKIVKEQEDQDNVCLHVTMEAKARLIALRYDMMSYTNTLKFSEIDFTEPDYFCTDYFEKKKPETKKLDLPLLKSKRSGWQERYRTILKEKTKEQKNGA